MSRFLPIVLLGILSTAIPASASGEHSDPKLDPSTGKHQVFKSQIPQRTLAFSAGPQTQVNIFLGHTMADFELPRNLYGSGKLPRYQDIVQKNPQAFENLKLHAHRISPASRYAPALINTDFEYDGLSDREYGYCWGFATMIRNFSFLGFFKKEVSDRNIPDRKSDFQGWLKYYYLKIDAVLSGKATVIQGFESLRELTLVPEFELYLKLASMFIWKNRAIRTENLDIFYNATKKMSLTELEAVASRLEMKLKRGELPKILFSSAVATQTLLGGSGDIHVVLVYKVERPATGGIRIHVWDVNFYGEDIKSRSDIVLQVSAAGEVTYTPWYSADDPKNSARIARIELAPEDELENAVLLTSLDQFCRKNPAYCDPATAD